MKQLFKLIVLGMLFTVFMSVSVSAKNTNIYIEDNRTTKHDLNGDGKKEKIKVVAYGENSYFNSDGSYHNKLYINGKLLYKGKGAYLIVDLDRKDKYHEIVEMNTFKKKLNIFRYDGKTLKKKYSFNAIYDGKSLPLTNYMKSETLWDYWINTPGNNTIRISGYFGPDQNIEVDGIWGIQNGRLVLKKIVPIEDSVYAGRKWSVYRYARTSNNSLLYTVSNTELKIYEIKVTPTYTYMKVRKNKKPIGWVIFKTQNMKISPITD